MTRTSTNDNKHPYLKLSFWRDPANHFWENNLFTESGKDYFRNSLQAKLNAEKRPYILDK